MSDNNIMDIGFDDAKVVKQQGVDKFKQEKHGKPDRVSIIVFKTFLDGVLASKAREKGEPLTDQEKADYATKVETRLAEQIGKKPGELTEVDRTDIKNPRFSVAMTHFRDGIGTIRCLSQYEGNTLKKAALCCEKMGDADQSVATIILRYPIDDNVQVDPDLLKKRRFTFVEIWKLPPKKFKKVESVYVENRANKMYVIDLKVTLDGEPKFQKQLIETAMTAYWAREDTDPEIRAWVLDQGMRAYKYVSRELGFEMKADKLAERLGMPAGSGNPSLGAASAAAPIVVGDYDRLLD